MTHLGRSSTLLQVHNREDFPALLTRLGLTRRAVELGVFRGDFAFSLLSTWPGEEMILVDPWRHLSQYLDSWNLSDSAMEENFSYVKKRMAIFGTRVRIMRTLSAEAAPRIADASCDFVYIDANHAYRDVKRDLELWYPKIRPGGILAGHDYFDAPADKDLEPMISVPPLNLPREMLTSYGVKSAVDEFVSMRRLVLYATSEPFPSWYFLKPCFGPSL